MAIHLLEQLLPEALNIVLSDLDPHALVQLHAAAAAGLPAVKQRLAALKCSRHWYSLSKRMSFPVDFACIQVPRESSSDTADTASDASQASSTTSEPESDSGSDSHIAAMEVDPDDAESDDMAAPDLASDDTLAEEHAESPSASNESSSASDEDEDLLLIGIWSPSQAERRQIWQKWQMCSKHDLLEIICSQVQHINDIAAMMHYCATCDNFGWRIQLKSLGLLGLLHHDKPIYGMKLQKRINQAFMLGFEGFLDISHDKEHEHNLWRTFLPLDAMNFTYNLEFRNHLTFPCTLYRLQQLPPHAVLARFLAMLSRCCRLELVLLSQVLLLQSDDDWSRKSYIASKQETPATDVSAASSQNEPCVAKAVNSLTYAQRSAMMLCVRDMVNAFVSCQ